MTARHEMAPAGDPLEVLVVFDRLEVGPVEVGPRGLRAPYRTVRGAASEATELAYRYEEDVFDPASPADRGLAGMIASQVALNYGLFAREIVFHAAFDEADRAFLRAMAANTAREIYVNKILRPNPFLRPPATEIPVVLRPSYARAELVFPDTAPAQPPAGGAADGWAVLSSGGKESLLSFGLLEELGCAPHAIFVNESGRHWYTALNGYRHLRATRPERTHRVWTNADRLFAWMLRQMPFVRQDFDRVRADVYPIRLWTVAVFLFGALPLLRRFGLGGIVIGDEYDTTRRARYRGIPHYDGLYDQSRYFDDALCRYYRRKGWGWVQCSVVRCLSELLVERVLSERYETLWRQQVSCHAAHLEGERALPCGRCEKCRRVVSMLVALGKDPAACGYEASQVEACLAAFAEHGAHQERAVEAHTLWLLRERLPRGAASARAQARPEVMHLRFDPERSPVETVPRDLRRPLYRKLLEHAEGALRRQGRLWVPFDLWASRELLRPFPFEGGGRAATRAAGERSPSFRLGELTWPEARRRLRETDTALLPVGSIEQHGPHLPLDTDAWDAAHLCERVAEACSEPKPLVLPAIPYGVSYHHMDFPGTLSVSPETLSRYVYEVGISAARQGICKLIVVNGHGGNIPALQYAAQIIHRDAQIFVCVDSGETSEADIAAWIETPNDAHAGEIETSTALATRPHLVRLEEVQAFVPRFSSRYLDFSAKRRVEWYAHTAKISPSGVLGDPTRASKEKGEKIWERMVANLVDFVESLKGLTLDEIYQRRH